MTHDQITWMLGKEQNRISQQDADTRSRHEEGLWYHDNKTGKPTTSLEERSYRFNRGVEEYKIAWDVIDRITGGIWSIAGMFA